MKLTDCLANILKKNNIKHVFGLQGGAVVHIFDSIEKKRIGVWYKNLKYKSLGTNDKKIKKLFFKNLFKIGYRYFNKNKRMKKDIFLIKAFQRRFFPKKVSGKIDQKTFEISHFLANQLKN